MAKAKEILLHTIMQESSTNNILLPLFLKMPLKKIFLQGAIFTFIFSIIFFILSAPIAKKYFKFILYILILIHVINIECYAFDESMRRSFKLSKDEYNLFYFEKMPFQVKRQDVSINSNLQYNFTTSNPRCLLLCQKEFSPYARYNLTDALLLDNFLFSLFRTDTWLKPIDQLFEAYHGKPFSNSIFMEKNFQIMDFLKNKRALHPSFLKITGVSEDTLQVFSQAHEVENESLLKTLLTHTTYSGDILFVSPTKEQNKTIKKTITDLSQIDLSGNERLSIPCNVKNFSANTLEVIVNIGEINSAWLYYSDAWHPFWKATVNNHPVDIYKSNLAYKAVPLEKGLNVVKFHFENKMLRWILILFGLNAMFWVGWIFYRLGRLCLFAS
ncbi:MAG: hypothetical protein HQL24_03480 [Candidatus Omnitrophica bacterium]|nr:hypothetical protein [Candidatus Omnitrophota bacterium]